MKRNLFWVCFLSLVVFASFAYAQTGKRKPKGSASRGMMGSGNKETMMQGRGMGGMMMGGMCGPMMMESMMGTSMASTSDGGVVVLRGEKLIKYDENLNIVKEVEIKVDMQKMQNQMQQMMNSCPMMQNGMRQNNQMNNGMQQEMQENMNNPDQ